MMRIFKKKNDALKLTTYNGGFSEIRSEILHVVGVMTLLGTFDVVSVNIPIISFSYCTHV